MASSTPIDMVHIRKADLKFAIDIIIIIVQHLIIIIIIITRPKPAYGRQGLAGSWGQDTDQAGTFWDVLNHENQPGTLKNYKNRPGTMKNQAGTL